jgi:hypothetical protein
MHYITQVMNEKLTQFPTQTQMLLFDDDRTKTE